MKALVLIATICFINPCVESCALPFWWSEKFDFPRYYPQAGEPKTRYRYRETLHQSDPNNYVHIQEYSEYTWWEHGQANPNVLNADREPTHFKGLEGIFPNNVGINGMIPEGTDVGINGMIPGDLNLINKKSGVTPNVERERERNENEQPSKSGDVPEDKEKELPPTNGDVLDGKEKEQASKNGDDLEGNDIELVKSNNNSTSEAGSRSGNLLSDWWYGPPRVVNETEPCKVSDTDINSLRSMIENMFSLPRDHLMHPDTKEKAREDIMNKFKDYGLQVWTQNFTTPMMTTTNGTEETKEGVNLIGVIPGSKRGQLDDGIVLVGAHYDTVADTNGVDDNGSGLAVMLEVARAITEARCRLNNTLMFVAFDHEEDGAMGSNYFVDHYLIPEELKRARAQFQGAFILDGIMNYNDIPNTQELPRDYAESLPGLQYFVNNTGNRGNFLAMISRNDVDSHLSHKLMDAWQGLGDHQYKLFNLAVNMGNEIPSPSTIERHLNFLRSDHATFWYHNSSHFPESLNAVLLTDTGPFRGQMKECYHSKCDDLTAMSPEKLQFARKTANALTATLVELTSATAAGNQIYPNYVIILLQVLLLHYVMKAVKRV